MPEGIVFALGGNALIREGERGTLEEQAAHLSPALACAAERIRRGDRLLLTHGNGPQVGHILTRVEAAGNRAYPLPLDVCVAQTQGETGYLIQQGLSAQGVDRPVAGILTRTVIDRDDPRLHRPTKPVGPFLPRRRPGLDMIEDPPHGFRRLAPSPLPVRVIEAPVIRKLFEEGVVVVAAGGGGIPVRAADGGFVGVEAVIDKDLASSTLASEIGAERILDLTSIDAVRLNFGTSRERRLECMTVAEARKHLEEGQFPPGSMGPKIEGAIRFLENGGREVVVTSSEKASEGLEGRAGTRIVR